MAAAGLLQIGLGVLRLGRWFRAVSVAVVHGMLAGIGLVLVAGQVYAKGDATSVPASGVGTVLGLAALPGASDPVALAVGVGTVLVLVLWPRWRRAARLLPAPLAAIRPAAVVTGAFGLPVRRVEVRGLFDAVQLPSPARAGLLVHAGCKPVPVRELLPVREMVPVWREHQGEAVVLAVTAFAIVATNLFEGVLVGLAPAVAKTAWDISRVQVRTEDRGGRAGRTGGRQRRVSAAAEAARRAGGLACRPGRAAGAGSRARHGAGGVGGGAGADDGVVRLWVRPTS
ncbi:SulP family inorganic anion transporter [Streptomyces sp. NPDC017964]|uniref:SulP family inorganic anion transporter n=1 Tax=Streptomyces sp. NPDC017964 TaxID=3365022 RepID=UPI0037B9AB82